MEQGWILIHRKLKEKGYYKKSAYIHLWIHILLSVNHKPKEFMWNNSIIVVKEGQMITGRKELASQTGIPESSIERILNMLESEHQIEQQKTTKYRLITIVNWKKYQTKNTKADSKRTTDGQQADTNKECNNVKNEKEEDTETSSVDIPILIKAFEGLNPASKKFYGIPVQRKACKSLIETYGLDRVIGVIEKTLPKTNGLQFFPVITTPLQLSDKWVALESAVRKYQSEKLSTKNKYPII